MSIVTEINVATGETVERPFTEQELEQAEQDRAAAAQAVVVPTLAERLEDLEAEVRGIKQRAAAATVAGDAAKVRDAVVGA